MKQLQRAQVFAVVLACALCSCASTRLRHQRKYDRKQAQAELLRLETPGLVIGEFPLSEKPVVDGDTVRVSGLSSSLRLLGIDAEETFKKDTERRAYEAGWQGYVKEMRGDSRRPVKMATPLGEEAKTFAKQFFGGASRVRLERDHPKEIRDYYHRYLSYVLVQRGGVWMNYNVECVRAGMSPYFTKYGYSRRFHADFLLAEKEARLARRGIWDPAKEHYDDYDERAGWWNARAEVIQTFEAEAAGQDNHIVLTHWDSPARLEKFVDKEVVILGSVGEIRLGDRGPTRVHLSRRLHTDFALIFFDKDVLHASGVQKWQGEYVRVKGFVTRYVDKRRKRYELQIVVNLPSQISGPGNSIPGDGNAP